MGSLSNLSFEENARTASISEMNHREEFHLKRSAQLQEQMLV